LVAHPQEITLLCPLRQFLFRSLFSRLKSRQIEWSGVQKILSRSR
jgi:hypothetical protein